MKKYLSLIGVLALGATSSLSVIACGETGNTNPTPPPSPNNPATENIKQWSQQTSNIAKSLILAKDNNFNTNRLLTNALNSTNNNIENHGNDATGTNYDTFKNVWGYNQNIEGIDNSYFNSDSDATIDNAQLANKEQITETISSIQTMLGLVNADFINNETLWGLLTSPFIKPMVVDTLWDINENGSIKPIIDTVKGMLPSITQLFNNFNAFNAEKELGEDYKGDKEVAKSVLGENKDGWLSNYSVNGFKSEAFEKDSSVLKAENFTDWDQVAMFKSSVDLNSFIWNLSNQTTTFGKMFDDAIEYDNNANAINFNLETFANEFQSIVTLTPENIIGLISNLIPLVKYQFGILPTTPLKEISTITATDPEKGILNIKDILETVKNIILTKDGFTNFITDIFFSETEASFSLKNYITLDFTCKNNKSLSETISNIKPQVTEKLGNLYTESIEPMMKKYAVEDIVNAIKTNLEQLTEKTGFGFELNQIQNLLEIVNDALPFIDQLLNYSSKDELSNDWENLWGLLGLNSGTEFKPGSAFAKLHKFLADYPTFLENVDNLLTIMPQFISDTIDVLVNKVPVANIDFTNEKLWSIDETTNVFNYDENKNETTISYDLTDKITNKTYKVTVVVKGNADTALTETRQVWLQSIK